MTKLPILSAKKVIRALRAAGFEDAPKRGKGSHVALIKRGTDRTRLVIVPNSKSLPRGTFLAILEQAGLSKAEFLGYLEV
jgi:predicted RNA binding protein YcfA (HicA-like mRNA interferase family)